MFIRYIVHILHILRFMIHNPDASLSRTSLPRIDHKRFVKLVYASLILHNLCTVRKDDAVTFEGADKQWLEFFRRAEASACPSCTRYKVLRTWYMPATSNLHAHIDASYSCFTTSNFRSISPLISHVNHPASPRSAGSVGCIVVMFFRTSTR